VLDQEQIQKYGRWIFYVQHDEEIVGKPPTLPDCLKKIKNWSNKNTGHSVLTIHLDLKKGGTHGDDNRFVEELDRILIEELGKDYLFSPKEIQGGNSSLLVSVKNYGWPTLKQLEGKFIIVLSGDETSSTVQRRRSIYSSSSNRVAFVDLDQRAASKYGWDDSDATNSYYTTGDRIFINIQLGRNDWTRLARHAHEEGFVTRVWKANHEEHWNQSVNSQVNIIATDILQDKRNPESHWATMGSNLFWKIQSANG